MAVSSGQSHSSVVCFFVLPCSHPSVFTECPNHLRWSTRFTFSVHIFCPDSEHVVRTWCQIFHIISVPLTWVCHHLPSFVLYTANFDLICEYGTGGTPVGRCPFQCYRGLGYVLSRGAALWWVWPAFRVPDSMVLQSLKISTAVFGILLNIVPGIRVRIYLRIASTHDLDLIDLTFIKSQVLFKVYPSRDFSTNMTM